MRKYFRHQPVTKGSKYYVISDGEDSLAFCPCCAKPLTQEAAMALTKKLNTNWKGFSSIREILDYYKVPPTPPSAA